MPLLICPNCNVGMTQVQRSGVEIDICPQCRGVWLDRGELEKLLQPLRDQASEEAPSFLPPPQAPHPWGDGDHDDHHGKHGHTPGHHGWPGQGHHQPKGWRSLLDVFD